MARASELGFETKVQSVQAEKRRDAMRGRKTIGVGVRVTRARMTDTHVSLTDIMMVVSSDDVMMVRHARLFCPFYRQGSGGTGD